MKPRIILFIGVALAIAACATGEPAETTTSTPPPPNSITGDEPIPVIVDYSPTVSDVGGLLYLLSHPGVEVIAVSLPETGEAGCDLGAKVTLGILEMMGRSEVPVACSNEIQSGSHQWPEEFSPRNPALLDGLPSPTAKTDPRHASELIADAAATADRPVTIWAVGPLTNVARALVDYPDAVNSIERIVIMGGAVDVAGSPMIEPAEWNFYIDAAAAATVVNSGVPITLVPLDATNDVPVPAWYQAALAEVEQSPQIVYLTGVVSSFPNATSGFYYFWDELAAAVITGEVPVQSKTAPLSVVVGGGDNGWSRHDAGGMPVLIATDVEPNAFYNEFLTRLSGDTFSAGSGATNEEESYLTSVARSLVPLVAAIEATWEDPVFSEGAPLDPVAIAARYEDLLNAIDQSYLAVSALTAPESLAGRCSLRPTQQRVEASWRRCGVPLRLEPLSTWLRRQP
jgi:pyrimidine-specific ribonucleoside hydrolase